MTSMETIDQDYMKHIFGTTLENKHDKILQQMFGVYTKDLSPPKNIGYILWTSLWSHLKVGYCGHLRGMK